MADIRPFLGIRYNPAKVPDLSKIVTQPYDKISPSMKKGYLETHPHNFVRLILPDGEDRYQNSAALCQEWLEQSVLKKDARPAIYVYHQQFEMSSKPWLRKGFIAALRIEEFEKGTVLPHERTLSKPKADRLNLVRATGKDYEQIFMLYSDPEQKVNAVLEPSEEPDMIATDEYAVIHKVWALTEPEKLSAVQQEMADKTVLIADGHHRYETALNFRQEMEKQNPDLLLDAALRFKSCAFINIADPGLVILPTHRLVFGLSIDWNAVMDRVTELFRVTQVPAVDAVTELGKHQDTNAFALHLGKGKTFLLQLLDPSGVENYLSPERSPEYRRLDVTVLHALVIEHILGISSENIEDHVKYEREPREAIAKVDTGKFQAALLMNPTRVEQVRTLARLGERMPQKSTDFYPKLISGLVFSDIQETERV